MTSIPNTISLLRFQSIYQQNRYRNVKAWHSSNLRSNCCNRGWVPSRSRWVFVVKASADSFDSAGTEIGGNGDNSEKSEGTALRGAMNSLPPVVLVMKRNMGSKIALGLYIVFALSAIIVRKIMLKRHNHHHHGSVADLVRRGQLRSDRRGISKPLKYEDPFNNPLVKAGKNNSSVEMCGKVYRLEPVSLTKEQQSIHQKRRSRAYQWKRPTVFLKEGDSIPPDVDPDTVRMIPTNHPFATTVNDIDEDQAQNNVYLKHGVPFRVKAEHEAMQRRLEALQNEQKLSNIEIDPGLIRDLERPLRPSAKKHEPTEPSCSSADQMDPTNDGALQDEVTEL